MHYVSTRDADRRLTASEAIVEGLSRDGGLYLPEQIPQITLAQIEALAKLPYPQRAAISPIGSEVTSSSRAASCSRRRSRYAIGVTP